MQILALQIQTHILYSFIMRDAGEPKELYTSNILIVSKPITKVEIRFQSRDDYAEYQPPTTYYITRSNASTRKNVWPLQLTRAHVYN